MNLVGPSSPLVTVVMPVFNGSATLHQSMISVLAQTMRDLELIVVNDASTDDSPHIVEALSREDSRVRLVDRHQSGGPAAARNTGIDLARGRYLAFCDADDMWLPAKLTQQIALAQRTGAALIYSAYHRINASHSGNAEDFVPAGRVVPVPPRLSHADLLRGNQIGNLTALVDLARTGPVHMPDVPGAEDWALWLRITRVAGPADGVTEPLALYRAAQHGSHSSNRVRALRAVWTVLRDQEKLSLAPALFNLAVNSFSAIQKSRI